jgi:hypothetical protein
MIMVTRDTEVQDHELAMVKIYTFVQDHTHLGYFVELERVAGELGV